MRDFRFFSTFTENVSNKINSNWYCFYKCIPCNNELYPSLKMFHFGYSEYPNNIHFLL